MISDDFLDSLKLPRGQRVVVDHEERGQVLRALDGCAYKLTAGGSLSNTLVALARLGSAGTVSEPASSDSLTSQEQARAAESAIVAGDRTTELMNLAAAGPLPGAPAVSGAPAAVEKSGQVHVSMVGSVGSDPLGDFYRTKLLRANVHFLSPPIPAGTTGTVIVLTTPDAQRTMLSYQVSGRVPLLPPWPDVHVPRSMMECAFTPAACTLRYSRTRLCATPCANWSCRVCPRT